MTEEEASAAESVDALVRRAGDGDRTAIAELYRRYEASMIAAIHEERGETLRGLMESVDLVQSVWTDVLDDLACFEDRGPGSFTAWLHACLRNKIRAKGRYHRAARRDVHKLVPLVDESDSEVGAPPPATADPTPSQVVSNSEELERLGRVLDRFPETQRLVLTLRLRDELPYADIAKRIDKSVEATKKLHGRALQKLIGLLRE